MISYEYEDLFEQNSNKQYSIEVYNGSTLETTITNTELYQEQIERCNPLCTEDTLRYGACESSYIKFKVKSNVGTLKGRRLLVYITPNATEPLQLGEYYVDSDKLSDDRASREIIAYDRLNVVLNADMLTWYKELGLPKTMKQFRDSFFDYFGIEQIEVTLCNDNMLITETILADTLPGLEVLRCILAGNGCLGCINNEGKFKYINFTSYATKAYGTSYKQGTLVYEDYTVQKVTGLRFYSNKCEIYVGDTSADNIYIMEDNFLFYDKIEEDLTQYVQNIFNVIKETPTFRPLKAQVYGDPCVEVGDRITFTTPSGTTLSTLVLQKVEKGVAALSDEYEVTGTQYYEYDLNYGSSQIRRLWNNTIALQNEVDNARTYVYAQRNMKKHTIGHTGEKEIISITLNVIDDTIPVFLATIPLVMSLDGEITFRYYLDGIPISEDDDDTVYLTKGEQFVTISTYFEAFAHTRPVFKVTAQTGYRKSVERQQTAKILSLKDWIDNQSITVDGDTATFNYDYVEQPVDTTPPEATIDFAKLRAMIFASGLASKSVWNGIIEVSDEVSSWDLLDLTSFETVEDTVIVDFVLQNRRVAEDGSFRTTQEGDTRIYQGEV